MAPHPQGGVYRPGALEPVLEGSEEPATEVRVDRSSSADTRVNQEPARRRRLIQDIVDVEMHAGVAGEAQLERQIMEESGPGVGQIELVGGNARKPHDPCIT